jgi:murein L,D-transpeptidase YcbB/YkuD
MPDSWRDNGGQDGAMREVLERRVVITQTRAAHAMIKSRLNEIRRDPPPWTVPQTQASEAR